MATYTTRGRTTRAQIRLMGVYDSQTFESKAAARAWGTQREAEILSGARGEIPAKPFGAALERYARDVSPAKKGSRWEIVRLNLLGRDPLAQVALANMDGPAVAAWRDRRLQAVCAASVRREWNLLSAVCNIAVREWKWLRQNPFSKDVGVRRPANGKPRFRVAQAEEIERIQAIANSPGHRAAVDAFLFGCETAMRQSEICRLKPQDVTGAVARLADTKNGTARDVPLSRRALGILAAHPAEPDQAYFHECAASIDTMWRKITHRAGVVDLHFHDSRHTAATRLAKKLHVLDLARMMGIKDLKVLMVYYNETAADIAKKLDLGEVPA